MQITAACSPRQKVRVEHRIATIKEVAGKTILQTPCGGKKRHVDCQLRGGPRTESKSGEVGHAHGYTSFGPANEGLWRTDGTRRGRSHPKVLDEGDELARHFIIRASTRETLEEHAASEAIRRAAATPSRPMEDIRVWYPLFLLQALPRQTSGNGPARTVSGTRGFDRTSRSEWLVGAIWRKGILVRH